jgi:hypothetical protein
MTLTRDLKNSFDAEKKLLAIECLSAPSQKLGTGDLYNVRAVIDLQNEANGNPIVHFQKTPRSLCTCGNGGLFCAHLGALILLLHVIQKTEDDFESLVARLPDPIHKVEAECIPVSMAFPRPGSEGKHEEMQVVRDVKQAVDEDQLDDAMREADEEVLVEVICNKIIPGIGVMDVSEADTLPICQMTRAWLRGPKV